jgi:Spy/CpxP family protein refolding chaperone
MIVKTLVQIIKPSHQGEHQMLRNIKMGLVKNLLAIAVVSLSLGAVAIPSLVSAQNSSSTNTSTTMRKPHQGDAFKQLNLTEAQKAQLKTIHESAKTQRQNVLTPEQRAKIEQARQSGERKGIRKSLNLTEAQKQQMKAIGATTKTQVQNVLTPEQKSQLEKIRQERKAQRGNR